MKITEVFEKKGSFVACLAAAGQQAVVTRKAVREMEQELCTVFRTDNAANLAEQMAMKLETATQGSREAGAVEEAFEMSVKIERYNGLSRTTADRAAELIDHIVRIHTGDGGCKQCHEDCNHAGCHCNREEQIQECVFLQIEEGELRGAREAARKARSRQEAHLDQRVGAGQDSQREFGGGSGSGSGVGSRCRWTEPETVCGNETCPLWKDDIADTTAQSCSGQGSRSGVIVADETYASDSRHAANMARLGEADTSEVFRWITQHMTENMRVKILQVVAGKGVTGAQIKDAMAAQMTTEEQREALSDLFECRASEREIRALQLQLQEYSSPEEAKKN
jgi:hypothetical protein